MRASLVILASAAVCYGGADIFRLGFYHDDWTFLSALHFAGGGLAGHMSALMRDVPALALRPTIVPLYALGHHLFGLDPLPWQLSLLAANAALAFAVYAVVARFGASRRIALTAAVLYLAYPSKDATMFWPGAIVCSASLAAFLFSYLAHLEHVRTGSRLRRALAPALLLFSLATYELALFLIPVFLLTPAPDSLPAADRRRRGFLDAALVAVVLLAYKFLIVPRLPGFAAVKTLQLSPFHLAWVYAAAANAVAGPKLVAYTVLSAWKTLRAAPWLAGASVAICVFLLRREPKEAPAANGNRRRLLLMGAAMAVLGCLPLALSDYTPTPLNHQNRINQVFLLGPVLLLAAHLAGQRARKAEVAALAAAAVFLTAHAGFASVWAESYRRQLQVRDLIRARVAEWPTDTVLLLLLPERYVGQKAPVFDAHWDISGAVRIWTGEPSRGAMTVRPGRVTSCSERGLRLTDSIQPFSSVRLLDAGRGTLAAPGASDCPRLLSPP